MVRLRLLFTQMLKFFCCYKISRFTVLLKFFIFFLFQISFFSAQENRKDTLNDTFIYVEKNLQIFSNDDVFSKQLQNAGVVNAQKIQICNSSQASENLNKTAQVEIEVALENQILVFKDGEAVKQEKKDTQKKIQEFQKRKKNISQPEMFATHSEGTFKARTSVDKTYISPTVHHYFLGKFLALKDFSAKENLKFIHAQEYVFYNSKSLDFCFSPVFSVRPPPFLS